MFESQSQSLGQSNELRDASSDSISSNQNTTPSTMTDGISPDLDATGRSPDPMFDILEATEDKVVAIRTYNGSTQGYRTSYELLGEKTEEYGIVHVFEDLPRFTVSKYLSNVYGIIPDLRYGSTFDIGRYGWKSFSMSSSSAFSCYHENKAYSMENDLRGHSINMSSHSWKTGSVKISKRRLRFSLIRPTKSRPNRQNVGTRPA